MIEECRSVDVWMNHISDCLQEHWEEEEELSIEGLVYEMVDNSKSAMLADALEVWKESGISKEDFLKHINHYSDYLKAMSDFIKAAAIASEQVIPDDE